MNILTLIPLQSPLCVCALPATAVGWEFTTLDHFFVYIMSALSCVCILGIQAKLLKVGVGLIDLSSVYSICFYGQGIKVQSRLKRCGSSLGEKPCPYLRSLHNLGAYSQIIEKNEHDPNGLGPQ